MRGRAPWSTVLLSPLYALALTVIAGIVFGVMSFLLHYLGMASGGLLHKILGVATHSARSTGSRTPWRACANSAAGAFSDFSPSPRSRALTGRAPRIRSSRIAGTR